MPDQKERLISFLVGRGRPIEIQQLHADASTRGYFRVGWDGGTATACVYPETLDPAVGTYVDVTELFLAGGLPVAEIIDVDTEQAVVVQEDLGDRIVRDELREELIDQAIRLIARIQSATPLATERDSIASRLKFDTDKLSWELDYFKTHYFTTMQNRPLCAVDDAALNAEFLEISTELEGYARVLCHRDFHAANLMIDGHGQMRIIDHQDARIGSAAYDLVSLLLDRVTELPAGSRLAEKQQLFLNERISFGMDEIKPSEFLYEFRLQTIQRCLKAAGTFSYQSTVRGKTHFVPFIKPMFRAALSAAEEMGRFDMLQSLLLKEIEQ